LKGIGISDKAARLFLIAACCWTAALAHAEHRRILPAPRELRYGTGMLKLEGIGIRFDGAASPEDQFSAETLAGCLNPAAQTRVLVNQGGSGLAIVLRRTGANDPLPVPGEKPGPDSREAYTIRIDAGGAEIRARSSAGIYYGVQTMCQMFEDGAESSLPEAVITDWPEMAYRATMVDISEGQLLHVAEIKRQLDLMARLKMNQYFLYNELTIALDGLPPGAPGARMSKSDVREIVAYAAKRHIDVVPCLELYGHLHDLFRREEYSELADFPHGVEFDPANPGVGALLRKWSAEYMELFPSSFVHIGFDETWQLQQAAQNGSGSPADYFVQQLRNVSGLFTAKGKTVMAWADIMVKFPDIVKQLPPGIIAVPWFYDPHPDPEYKYWIDPLAARQQPFLVAPGVNAWSEIAPDYTLSFDNIDTLLAAGRKAGSLGMVNTIWSDDVQVLKRPIMPGIAYGAAAAWQHEAVDRSYFYGDYAALSYPSAVATKIAVALKNVADSETALQDVLGQYTMPALWQSPFAPKVLAQATAHKDSLRKSRLLAEAAEEALLGAIDAGAKPTDLDAYLVESRLLDYAGMKFQYGVEITAAWKALGTHPDAHHLGNDFETIVVSQQHGKLPDLMEGITELKPQFREAWLDEYTSYRLASALGRWEAEYEYWRELQANLFKLIDEYDPARGLPPFANLLPANQARL
jgi:hypothetical protein